MPDQTPESLRAQLLTRLKSMCPKKHGTVAELAGARDACALAELAKIIV